MKLALDLDATLVDTHEVWSEWLADARRRFAAIAPLDPNALPSDRGAAAAVLDEWAARGIGDWRAALERWAEDRAPLFFRPDAAVNAALRRLRGVGHELGAFSDAPEPLVRIALSHVGAARELGVVEAGASAQARLLARLGGGARVIASRDELLALAA